MDAMLSGVLITLIFYAMLGTNERMDVRYAAIDSQIGFKRALLLASDSLVLTGGKPGDWDERVIGDYGLASFGLASAPNVLDYSKLARMQELNMTNYTEMRRALGLAKSNVSIEVLPLGGGGALYAFGTKPDNETTAAVFERLALLNGTTVVVRLEAG